MSKLTLGYRYDASFFDPQLDRDDFGWLSMSVATDRFSGEGGFWIQWQDVKAFGEALDVFPIGPDPIQAEWGFNMLEGDDLILRLTIAAANKRGDLVVGFVIADHIEPVNRVSGSFLTNYPDVDAFRSSIARLMNFEVEEAVLTGR